MELKVNKDKCIGCGMCVSTLEEVFDFDDDNQAKVIQNPVAKENEDTATELMGDNGCPTGAIEEA